MNIIKPIIKDNNNINPLILSQTPKSGINHKRIKNNIKILNGTNSLKNSSSKFLINTCENSNMNISYNFDDNISPKHFNINNYKENKKGISLKKRNSSLDKNRRIKYKTNEKFSKKIQKEIKKEIKKETSNNSTLTTKNLKKIIFIQRWWRTLSCIILIQTIYRGFIYRKNNLENIKNLLNNKEDNKKKKITELISCINEGKKILNYPFSEIGKFNTPKILNIPKPHPKKINSSSNSKYYSKSMNNINK